MYSLTSRWPRMVAGSSFQHRCKPLVQTVNSTVVRSWTFNQRNLQQPFNQCRAYANPSDVQSHSVASDFKTPSFETEIPLSDGSLQKVIIQPTPKATPSKLAEELKALLTTSRDSPAVWTLDARGDAVHCAAVVPTRAEAEKITERVMNIANDKKHHPHISKDDMILGCQMLITCTTHNPRGLGLRDIRLATSISQVIKECQMELQTEAAQAYRDTALAQLQKHREEMECAVCKQ